MLVYTILTAGKISLKEVVLSWNGKLVGTLMEKNHKSSKEICQKHEWMGMDSWMTEWFEIDEEIDKWINIIIIMTELNILPCQVWQ